MRWRDRAIHEAQEAYDWDEAQTKGRGEQLIAELDEHIAFLLKHPNGYPKWRSSYRKVTLKHFPYQVVTGLRSELLKPLVAHMEINAVVCADPTKEEKQMLDTEAATNMKRLVIPKVKDWMQEEGRTPYMILDTQEVKTTWHPIERGQGGAGGY